MPTQDRREFIPSAVECFLRQDWPNKELVVVDSGKDPIRDLLDGVPNVKYVFYKEPRPDYLPNIPIGTKRNLACFVASGEAIVHWDDDDVSHLSRISHQIEMLKSSGKSVAGYNRIMEFSRFKQGLSEYAVPEDMAAGTSLCYLRSYWKDHPFQKTSFGEDWTFIEEAKELGQLVNCDGRQYITSTAHPGNTCKRG